MELRMASGRFIVSGDIVRIMEKPKMSVKLVKLIKQFISYFFVGGMAAIVEWIMFFLFSSLMSFDYMLATVLAFLFSTTANWILGRILTFRNSSYENKRLIELVLVFAVSLIGLLFNMMLMYLFVTVIGMNTDILKLLAKILATGIVFVWNFLGRKFFVYKEKIN